MTNRPSTVLELCRSAFWARIAAVIAGYTSYDKMEVETLRRISFVDKARDDTGNLAAYAAFKRRAFRSNAPIPKGALWPERVGRAWPWTNSWFYTPFWYLLEPQQRTAGEVLECIAILPRWRQELLLAPASDLEVRDSWSLAPMDRATIADLSYPVNAWSLGSLACAMHSCLVAGDAATARFANAGLIWLLFKLQPLLPNSEDLFLLLQCVCHTAWGKSLLHRAVRMNITDAEINAFAAAREASRTVSSPELEFSWSPAAVSQCIPTSAFQWRCVDRCI